MTNTEIIIRTKLFEWNDSRIEEFKFEWELINDITDEELNELLSDEYGGIDEIWSEILENGDHCDLVLNTYSIEVPSGEIYVQCERYIPGWEYAEGCKSLDDVTFKTVKLAKYKEVLVGSYVELDDTEINNLL